MTLTTPSRTVTRADLKEYLAPLMTALGSVDDFFDYEKGDYQGKSPVVFLNASGAGHPTEVKALGSEFFINVHHLVVFPETETEGYTERDAANVLDDMEQQLSSAVDAKKRYPGKWQDLSYEGRSVADQPEPIGGNLYLHEVFTLRIRMY